MRLIWGCVLLGMLCSGIQAEEKILLQDNFSESKLKERRASRGDWVIENGMASCTQDDELYKKYKNHGPIIFYDVEFQNGTAQFAYQADGARNVVFTANGADGHVFRLIFTGNQMQVRAFPPDSEEKSALLGREELSIKAGDWVPVTVSLEGGQATITVGKEFKKSYEHASFARSKTNISVGFSFGTVKFKDVQLTQSEN